MEAYGLFKRFNKCGILAQWLIIAAMYVFSARVGLLFALSNGNVSLIWPPAGIALAVVTAGGFRLFPGVVLGAFVANVMGGEAWLFPLSAALGNTIEAIIGAILLRRVLGFRHEMDRVRDTLGLPLLAAPISAIVAPTFGVTALWAISSIPIKEYPLTWLHWWFGDVIGMSVIAPAIFVSYAYGLPQRISWQKIWEGTVIGIAAFLGGFFLFGIAFPTCPALAILVIPLLILVAFRFSMREVVLANMLVGIGAVIGVGKTLDAANPHFIAQGLLTLCLLLLVSSLTAQLLTVIRMEWKHTEKALYDSELKHRVLFENASDAIIIIRGNFIFDCNVRTLEVFGCSREQIVGARLIDFSPPIQPDGSPSDVSALEKMNQALMGNPQFFEWLHCRLDKTLFTAEVSLNNMVLDEEVVLQAVIRDISKRKHAEEGLRQSEATIRGVFLAAPVGIGILKNRIQMHVNKCWYEKFGYAKEDVIGKSTRMFYESDAEYHRVGQALYNNLQENGLATVETKMQRKDGSLRDVILTTAPISQDDLSAGIVGIIQDITERKEFERALFENERKYRELVEYANSIILRWDSHGRITFLNEYGLRFFGYSTEEILGRHVIGTIVPPVESSGRDLEQLMEQISEDPKSFEKNTNENMRRNGERAWIAWTNRIGRDSQGKVVEILSVGTDITEAKLAQDALSRSEEQFRLIMENLTDLVAVLDLEGRRIYSSPSYSGILGKPDRLQGSLSFEQIHAEDKERVQRAFLNTVHTGVGHRLEYRLMDCNGNPHYIESQGSVIRNTQGNVTQVVVVSRDVTSRRQADEAIRELNVNLERRVVERTAELALAKERAESADRVKSAFLAAMSHELRTPLNSIIGFTGMVLQGLPGPLNPEQTKQLGMVQGSARHLLALINDVLDLSKIEAGQLEVEAKPFNARASVEKVVHSVMPLAEKKGLILLADISPEVGEILSDCRRFEQIIINLINNGLKFTDKGQVCVACGVEGQKLVTRVVDTGIGIKPEDMGKLFQAFQQVDVGLTRNHEGTGLGLSICKRLVEKLGGQIWVESEWGVGSVFSFTIPIVHG